MLDIGTQFKKDFPILADGKIAYFDSAASAQKPSIVLDAIDSFYKTSYANVHRGVYSLSQQATEKYEASREIVRSFINAKTISEVIFTKGTTEAINLVAYTWGRKNLTAGDEVLVTIAEHHSNIVPWQILAIEKGIIVKFVLIKKNGEIDLNSFHNLLSPKTKLFAVTMLANGIGIVPPYREMIATAKQQGVVTLLDAAQVVSHEKVDVQELGCDFLAFSGHKLYAPTGIGVLWGRESLLEAMPPFMGGGDMIRKVSVEGTDFNDLPYKFEAGTPPIVEAVGLGKAIEYVQSIGLENINLHEALLIQKMEAEIGKISEIEMLGEVGKHKALISLVSKTVHAHDLAQFLDNEGVCVRAGHHCAQPLMRALGITASARASLGLYNTFEDVDRLVSALQNAVRYFK